MENLAHLFSMDMVMVTLRMAIPLILASIGSVICEEVVSLTSELKV